MNRPRAASIPAFLATGAPLLVPSRMSLNAGVGQAPNDIAGTVGRTIVYDEELKIPESLAEDA